MMTNETIEAAARQLAEALKDRTEGPFTPERLDPSLRAHDVTSFELLSHCLWLLNEIPGMLLAGKREKAMRWLCWCQGVAFAKGWVSTIDELKQANKGASHGE